MRDSDRPMTQREAYQRGYAAGYAAAQSGPPSRKRTVAEIIGDPRTSVTTRPESPAHYVRVCPISDSVCGTPVECGRTPFGCKLDGPLQEGADGPAADPIADLCARLRKLDYGAGLAHDAADELERLARENAKWNELHRTIAEELGYSAETWPDHRNAPLAIAAAFVLSKQRVERAEAERDALRECVRAADAMRSTVYATDGCECSNCAKAREYDRARAKWEGKP